MKRQGVLVKFFLSLFLAWGIGGTTFAASITISTLDNPIQPGTSNQGWWSNSSSNFNSTNISTIIGTASPTGTHRAYLTYYLPQLSQQVVSATLFYNRRGASLSTNEEFETVGFFDVTTDPILLNTQLGPSFSVYNDLGSGDSYGQFVIPGTGPSDATLSFALSSAAVADISTAGEGYFSIGVSLLSNDGNDALFGSFGPQPTLILQFVPEPGTGMLLAFGTMLALSPLRQLQLRKRYNP